MVEILHFLFCESILQGSHIFYIRHEYYIAANPCMPRDCIREVSRLWIAASLAVLKLRSIKHKSSYTLFSFQSILIPRSDEYKKSLQQQRSFYHFGKLCSNAPQFLSSLIFIFRDGQVSCLDLFSFPLQNKGLWTKDNALNKKVTLRFRNGIDMSFNKCGLKACESSRFIS